MAAPNQTFDPGLTNQFTGQVGRIINPDGTFNVHRRGAPWSSWNPYLFLVDTSWTRFIAVVLVAFLLINIGFAGLYCAFGIEHLAGWEKNVGVGPFAGAFFFSVHTLTTVGYGNIYPVGMAANILAAVEAMVGLMGFAIATGLLYGRFSRPSAKIVFSERMVVAPYGEIQSLQFRIANQRSNNLTDLEATMLLMTVETAGGEPRRKYVELNLERRKVFFFPLTWTVVHPIDAASPLYGKTPEDLKTWEAALLILVKGYDDTFSQVVNTRYSYRHDEIEWGARFLPAFHVDETGTFLLELDRIHDRKPVLP
jgi:inward rectifier potassium channel